MQTKKESKHSFIHVLSQAPPHKFPSLSSSWAWPACELTGACAPRAPAPSVRIAGGHGGPSHTSSWVYQEPPASYIYSGVKIYTYLVTHGDLDLSRVITFMRWSGPAKGLIFWTLWGFGNKFHWVATCITIVSLLLNCTGIPNSYGFLIWATCQIDGQWQNGDSI